MGMRLKLNIINMKISKEEKVEAIRCIEMDIIGYEAEIDMKKHFLKNIIKKKNEFTNDELNYLSRSLIFDLNSRKNSQNKKAINCSEYKIMIELLKKIQNGKYEILNTSKCN